MQLLVLCPPPLPQNLIAWDLQPQTPASCPAAPLPQNLSLIAWGLGILGHDGPTSQSRRLFEETSDQMLTWIKAEASSQSEGRRNAINYQHAVHYGSGILGLAPSRTDLLAKAGLGFRV